MTDSFTILLLDISDIALEFPDRTFGKSQTIGKMSKSMCLGNVFYCGWIGGGNCL